MKRRTKMLLLVLGLLFGMLSAGSLAAAQTPQNTLPTTKTPSSAKFDLSGTISSTSEAGGPSTITMTGSGAIAGADSQFDLTVNAPSGAAPGGPSSIGISFVVTGNKMYFKFSGLDPSSDNQWYVTNVDTSTVTPESAMPGMAGSPLTNPALMDAYKITQVGKETLSGAVTKKYQVDVDLQKLEEAANAQSGSTGTSTAQISPNSKMTMWLWIGDANQYLYQFKLSLATTIEGAGLPSSSLNMDLTLAFHDFDTAVKIVAPENAKPLDMGTQQTGAGSLLNSGLIPLGGALGMPVGMMSGRPAGMPTTGAGQQADLAPWAALAAVFLLGGIELKRRSARKA